MKENNTRENEKKDMNSEFLYLHILTEEMHVYWGFGGFVFF